MSPHDYCTGWRQVRVFLKDFDIKAFVEFHNGVTLTVVKAGLSSPFFISHYACDDTDHHDTTLAGLPSEYRRPDGNHHSIRIRFRETGNVEKLLLEEMPEKPQDCWYSEFLDYDIRLGLSGTRFSDYSMADTGEDTANHERRAQLVGEILHYNTRLYLDTIRYSDTGEAIFRGEQLRA
jgi:hypothetical protein